MTVLAQRFATSMLLAAPMTLVACWGDEWRNPSSSWNNGTETGDWFDEDDGYDYGDGDGDDDSGGGKLDMPGEGEPAGPCFTLDVPWGGDSIVVGPEQAAELPTIVAEAPAYTTIMLLDGVYDLSDGDPIRLSKSGLSLRAASGDRDAVLLDGGRMLDELVIIEASRTSVAHLTLANAKTHAIRVTGAADTDTTQAQIYDVVIRDPGKQAILITRSTAGTYPDHGEIGCSQLYLGDLGRAALDGCEIAGIDARGVRGWDVHDNRLAGWWCSDALAQPAIHFWQASRDTMVQRNQIDDSAQGIGFGYGELPTGDERSHADAPCPTSVAPDHIGGRILNNAIWSSRAVLFASTHGVVSGIALERACAVEVQHNTVVALDRPQASIIYRWPGTDANIVNNLVTHSILPVAGAQAQLLGNVVDAGLENFVYPLLGDLHLTPNSVAIDAATDGGLGDDDIDAQARLGRRDVGADERMD
jgi:hypothetical protein